VKTTAKQQVEKIIRTYLDLDEDNTQVTTLNCNDVNGLIDDLALLVTKAAETK